MDYTAGAIQTQVPGWPINLSRLLIKPAASDNPCRHITVLAITILYAICCMTFGI